MSSSKAISRATWELYDIHGELLSLLESYDPETGEFPDGFDEQLSALAITTEEKVLGCFHALKVLAGQEEILKAESNRLRDRAKMRNGQAKRLKKAVGAFLDFIGRQRIELPMVTAYMQRNPQSVVIEDEAKVPGEFVEIVQTERINKKAILAALKEGRDVPGCRLHQGEGVRFK